MLMCRERIAFEIDEDLVAGKGWSQGPCTSIDAHSRRFEGKKPEQEEDIAR
jgi:hypothetical protein